ncbi:MAG: hypothetical protein UE068_09450 [Paludibacteraceae bacterium]|nr:hypothetical protein [Paludibacteraceae bacterium]
MDKAKYIKIAPEYGCEPIWISEDGKLYNYDDDGLVLSDPEISEPLLKWDSIFQNTFDSSYPPDSRFENAQQLHDYELKGIEIWKLIKNKFPESIVLYYSIVFNKEYDEPAYLLDDLERYVTDPDFANNDWLQAEKFPETKKKNYSFFNLQVLLKKIILHLHDCFLKKNTI